MAQVDYMLIIGANIYADPTYTVFYQPDKNSEDRIHLFSLENTENGLLLTTEIKDENSNILAKIDKNEFTKVDERYDVKGEIEKENGLTITKKEGDAVIFNARINEDGYVAVTGIFYIAGKKIYVADREIKINNEPRQTINGVNVHDSIFVGTPVVTLTDEGVKLSADQCWK